MIEFFKSLFLQKKRFSIEEQNATGKWIKLSSTDSNDEAWGYYNYLKTQRVKSLRIVSNGNELERFTSTHYEKE